MQNHCRSVAAPKGPGGDDICCSPCDRVTDRGSGGERLAPPHNFRRSEGDRCFAERRMLWITEMKIHQIFIQPFFCSVFDMHQR